MSAPVTIREVMTSPALFGSQFGGDSFASWRALLAAFYGLTLEDGEAEILATLTGRTEPPTEPFSELWTIAGRRAGKTATASLIAVFQAVFNDYRDRLAPGEVATVLLLAADRAQARSAMRFVRGLCEHPMIAPMIARQTETGIEFSNRSAIEIATSSFRSVRGYTLSACILDEIAYWFSEGANPDAETVAALRPALATLGGKLIAISSPYSRRGVLWNTFKRHFGGDSARILVAKAASRTLNPTLPQAVIDEAMADDAEAAKAEYLGEFRSDISTLLDPELLEACKRPKPLELPPCEGVTYNAFCDPSGGGADEYSLSIGHREGETTVIDLVRARRGSPAEITAEFATILKAYRVGSVTGDRYSGRWVRDEFAKHNVTYVVSEQDRSALYIEFLSALNSGRVELPPCQTALRQFAALERRTSRAGRDSIDHPPGGHDDRANSIAGVVATSRIRKATGRTTTYRF